MSVLDLLGLKNDLQKMKSTLSKIQYQPQQQELKHESHECSI